MDPTQAAFVIKAILTSAQKILENLGNDHPITQALSSDLESLIGKLSDGPFPEN